jgi:energy-coupling factor transport system ATP-binding protein
VIRLRGLEYAYPGAADAALRHVDLTVAEGEFVVVVGRNGSGKSTLARLLGGLDRPAAAGEAVVAGHDLLTRDGRLSARRDVGVVFQNPDNQLVGSTVEEDLAFGLENLGIAQPEIRRRVDEMLERFDLIGLAEREPHLLSGGQKQRTALAGALAIRRRLLVLDEPTAMLDPAGRREVLEAVLDQWGHGMTVVHVTQEMDEVALGDRVVALQGGQVTFDGRAADLFADAGLTDALGLGLPPAAEVGAALRRRGRVMDALPLDVEMLVAELQGGPR